jgi:methyltransferase (TIGR00027 family)
MTAAPKEAAVCSHQDNSRQGVGKTAHVVAMLRAVETNRGEGRRLINDPFASRLAGETGNGYVRSFASIAYFLLGSDLLRFLFYILSPFLANVSSFGMIDGIAIRSRRIDDEIIHHIRHDNIKQVAVLGAGLDARAWRLKYDHIFQDLTTKQSKEKVKYFELDFKEIFDFKLRVVNEYCIEQGIPQEKRSDFEYIPVVSDLSLPTWPETLMGAGFDPKVPTLWILEGFTGYLTEFELRHLLTVLSNQLSAKSSRFIATFLRPESLAVGIAKGLHQSYRPAHPAQLVESFGWTNATEETFDDIGRTRYDRPIYPLQSTRGHVIVTADKL